MTVFVCIDKNGGMSFNGRRQSRDRAVISDIMEMTGGVISCSDYSLSLFEGFDIDHAAQFVFAENQSVRELAIAADTLVIYNWNRVYPFDFSIDISPANDGFELVLENEFRGFSHENITKQVWKKKQTCL